MKFKLRSDVVIKELAGANYLIALRSAWEEVPFILPISKSHTYLLHCFEEGFNDDEMLKSAPLSNIITEERLLRAYHNIQQVKLYSKYLIEVSEDE